ncbi:MAG: SDR family NAD(P)-dependent oxidoreductase [Candidatus Acidiferrales bacterium]|jgi:NADP-dependent 3-hydroxy acid dehydrogenase YdfG
MVIEKPLIGKTSLVTGASRGIGFAIAETLGRLGAKVAICARDIKKLEAAADKLRASGYEVLAARADVTRASEIASLVQKTLHAFGPIEILVNNAGIGYFGPIQNATEENWDNVLDTNLKSVFLVTKAVAPGMIEQKRGHVINIASLAGKNTFKNGGIYCASKWGLMGLTGCMAEDLREFGIRASAICPGSVNTEFSPHTGKDGGKLLQSDDIAHAVEMIVTQAPESFISEVLMRPTQKP